MFNKFQNIILKTDPWDILTGRDASINFIGGDSSWFTSAYSLLRNVLICVCVISILANIGIAIYSNIFGDSKTMAESKSSVINKLIMISVISGLLSLLTVIKQIIDSLYGF